MTLLQAFEEDDNASRITIPKETSSSTGTKYRTLDIYLKNLLLCYIYVHI